MARKSGPVKLKDGTVVQVCLKPDAELTDEEARVLDEYLQFCRERRAKRKAKKKKAAK
jgi:hypothetical protein